jgi:hypothetical protein
MTAQSTHKSTHSAHGQTGLEAWRELAVFQPLIENPCTYYVTGISSGPYCTLRHDIGFHGFKQTEA